MERVVVIHYYELGLKRGNRDFFENKLRGNIARTLKGCGAGDVRRISGRLLLSIQPQSDLAEIRRRLSKVMGVAYFADAWSAPPDLESLKESVWVATGSRNFGSFRIDTRRSEKNIPLTSMDINREIGAVVKERSGAEVDLENAELTVWIEMVESRALIYLERIDGPSGLPVGSSGSVAVLLSGGIDSPVAAWKMMKRGCSAVFIHFHSFPFTNKESQEKARALATLLAECQLRSRIYLVPFADVQRHIMAGAPAESRVILYRRYMLRLAERIAEREGIRVLVTGDSIGQVASQTIENVDVITRAVSMPILRPLIGDNKEEIIHLARQIGTYTISIQPDQDCCSLFVPRHPETRANLAEIEQIESRLDVAEALRQSAESAEVLLQYPAYETGSVRQL